MKAHALSAAYAVALWLLLPCHAGAGVPAFPGAEGFGSTTPGGRGGQVIFVTNLNDSGPGSFRAACESKGPRIVVFRVAGIIDLQTTVVIKEPFITIAGQTAPGDGICFRRNAINIETHDAVVRFLRVRPGDLAGVPVDGLMVGAESRNVVVDHCSVTWASDENLSPSGAIADVTVSWCLIAEGLNRNVHHKGGHGYGSLVRAVGGLSLHHNLWANNNGRNPRLGDNYRKGPWPTFDVRNNVMYNYNGLSYIGDTLSANYVANYLKPGPYTRTKGGRLDPTPQANLKFYLQGNVVAGQPAGADRLFSRLQRDGRTQVALLDAPLEVSPVRTSTPAAAYHQVLAAVGASMPVRDAVDRRIIGEVRTGAGAIVDSQWEVGGWPNYGTARPPRDSDRDGMPDSWETAHRLNPNDPKDAALDRDADGYTNIEEYLNSLATPARAAQPPVRKSK